MDITMRNTLATLEFTPLTKDEATAIGFKERDDHVIFAVQNTGSADVTLTVKAGNGIQGVNDLVLTVSKGTHLFKLESGRFKFISGENKGKVVMVSSGELNIAAVALV